MQQRMGKLFSCINRMILKIDRLPLWWLFFLLLPAVFAPLLILGEGSIFVIHDQLDEYMMNTVLTARHLGEGLETLPEMMGGVNASGLQPAAVLFVPLYRILPEFWAFLVQYAVVFAAGFLGMYFCVKELTGSSILSLAAAGCFCMLPIYPVYGLSQMGIPLVLYAFLCLQNKKKIGLSIGLLIFYGLTSHLVYTGYVVLSLWALALVYCAWQKKLHKWIVIGFLALLGVYVVVNYRLFLELFLGQAAYVSHREETLNGAMAFWSTVKDVFVNSASHSPSLHKYLIVPIVLLLVAEGIFFQKLSKAEQRNFFMALGGLLLLAGIALFYGLYNSEAVTNWKNSLSGFLRYFQMERYYWLYPAGWYLEFACVFGIWWRAGLAENSKKILHWPCVKAIVLVFLLWPTLQTILYQSIFYTNVNQINNGSGVTGYVSWENYYSEDLMTELENVIGREMSTYRIAHLGMSPCPSLMHGFYTVDGYSNNYSLEYKHQFRKVIAKELDKAEESKVYFDTWGNRCYLFNSITGSSYMLPKGNDIRYEGLEFDMQALGELGCEYIFSAAEIADAAELGLEFLGYYETGESYWGIWLYELKN